MAKTSALQSKLYELAHKYANEAAEEEKQAHKLAVQLQETSSRAQIARNKMHRVNKKLDSSFWLIIIKIKGGTSG